MVHYKKLQAARDRRDAGTRPLPADNENLLAVGDALNPLPLQKPIEPQRGSRRDVVLRIFRHEEFSTVEDLANECRLTEHQVRGTIGALRKDAHPIDNVGLCRFALRRPSRRSAA